MKRFKVTVYKKRLADKKEWIDKVLYFKVTDTAEASASLNFNMPIDMIKDNWKGTVLIRLEVEVVNEK